MLRTPHIIPTNLVGPKLVERISNRVVSAVFEARDPQGRRLCFNGKETWVTERGLKQSMAADWGIFHSHPAMVALREKQHAERYSDETEVLSLRKAIVEQAIQTGLVVVVKV